MIGSWRFLIINKDDHKGHPYIFNINQPNYFNFSIISGNLLIAANSFQALRASIAGTP